jgi:hypothetical protein
MPKKPTVSQFVHEILDKQIVDSYLEYLEYMHSECDEFIRNHRNSECIQLQFKIIKGVQNILNANNKSEYIRTSKEVLQSKLEYQKVVSEIAFDKKEKFTDLYYKESIEKIAEEYKELEESIEFLESEMKTEHGLD